MKNNPIHQIFTSAAASLFLFSQVGHAQPTSSIVYPGPDGKLDYTLYANESQTSAVNRMIDFSTAGYMGGGVAIPWVPVVRTLNPIPGGGDDRARIQTAINEIAAMPLSSAGFRGTLLLTAGAYNVSERVNINASGIVIRGEGQGTNGTVVTFTSTNVYGVDPYAILFYFGGSSGWTKVAGTETPITDAVVPAGTFTMTLGSTAGLSVGSRIIVHRTPNQAWIDWLKMKTSFWAPNPSAVDWLPQGYAVEAPRTITAINGNTITLDVPITQAIETQYGGGEVYRYTFNGAIRQCGIERIRLESTFTSSTDENHGWEAVRFRQTEDGWARQVTARYFAFACVNAWIHSKNITVEDCAMLDPVSQIAGGRRYSFNADRSSAILFQRNYTRNGRHDYVTSARTLGPTAFVDSLAFTPLSDTGPHQRYAEGILFDNVKGGQIAVQNRGSSGSGHGWSGAQVVLWNCEGTQLRCDAPKGAMNFALGCTGTKTQGNPWTIGNEPYGIWESLNTPITPRSLYYKQLDDRLGKAAMLNVTTQSQRNGTIFTELSSWQGNGAPPGAPSWQPVQVEVLAEESTPAGAGHNLYAAIHQPLPSNYPMTAGWTQDSGPGSAVFANAFAASTTVAFPVAGTYVLRFSASQSDGVSAITYSDSDTVTINADASPFGLAVTWDAGGGDNNWSTLLNWSDDASPTGDFVTFNTAGLLASGTTNTVDASQSIASLSYNFESSSTRHTTAIAAGQTLDVAGDFLLAGSPTATTNTNVTITGGTGALTVDGTSFQAGQPTPVTGSASVTTLDMSGLGTFAANLGTGGTFRLAGASTSTAGTEVTLKLANTSTITTNLLSVGANSGRGRTNILKLGSGTNTINANILSVGAASGRANGELSFETGTGTLLLRAADGTSAVPTMNMINNTFGHSGTHVSVVDFAGHSIDAKIDALNMGVRTGTNGGTTATLTFDTGTLEVGTAQMARNAAAASTGTASATINIGGGTASFAAINMASSGAADTSTTNATLNLTGGTTTVTGDIVKIGNTGVNIGATNATITLNGGILDMDNGDMLGGNIGDATNLVALALLSGTLQNVAEINGGGAITKTTSGVLTLSGVNAFTGDFTISTGEVIVTESGSLGVGPKTLSPQANGYFTLDGTSGDISLAADLSLVTAGLSLNNITGDNTINGSISIVAGSGLTEVTSDGGSLDLAGSISNGTAQNRTLQLSGSSAGANTVSGLISDGGAVIGLTKGGTGTWTLTNDANSFSGNVNVNNGELKITKSGALGTGTKNINFTLDGYLSLDGSAGAVTLSSDNTLRTAGPALLNIAGDNVINSPIAIIGGAAYTGITSDGGSLELAGGVSSEITSAYRRLELSGTSTGANTISGPITDGNAQVDIAKLGSGTWALTSAGNTYTGDTSVQEGILTVSTPNFADTSTVSIGTLANPGLASLNLPNAGDDTVATLIIDGVEQAAGKTYGNASSVLPVIATAAITGPGTITVPGSGTPYSIWADSFLPGNDVSDPGGDNDNDGLTNQQEFAFGLSPIDGSSVNPVLVQLDKTAGTFTYQRRAGTGLTYRILTSDTLQAGSWAEDLSAGQVATPSGDNETVVVTLTGAPLTATKFFVRVAAD